MSIEMNRSCFNELKSLCRNFKSVIKDVEIQNRFIEILAQHDVECNEIPHECRNNPAMFDHILQIWLEEHGIIVERKIWTEEEIKQLIQENDKVLYGALKKLYACQTTNEQARGETVEHNGIGFNGADSSFLSSVSEFLIKNGFLTDRQKFVVRQKLVKYNKQLTRLANA